MHTKFTAHDATRGCSGSFAQPELTMQIHSGMINYHPTSCMHQEAREDSPSHSTAPPARRRFLMNSHALRPVLGRCPQMLRHAKQRPHMFAARPSASLPRQGSVQQLPAPAWLRGASTPKSTSRTEEHAMKHEPLDIVVILSNQLQFKFDKACNDQAAWPRRGKHATLGQLSR